jgi:hypothetical protein
VTIEGNAYATASDLGRSRQVAPQGGQHQNTISVSPRITFSRIALCERPHAGHDGTSICMIVGQVGSTEGVMDRSVSKRHALYLPIGGADSRIESNLHGAATSVGCWEVRPLKRDFHRLVAFKTKAADRGAQR